MIFAQDCFLDGFLKGIETKKILSISEWADTYRFLPSSTSAEAGLYRTSRTPYHKEIMDVMDPRDNSTQKVVVMKGAQLGLSELLMNIVGHSIHQSPCSITIVLPTGSALQKFSKQRVDPMLNYSPVLRDIFKSARREDNTNKYKAFPGGVLNFASASSANDLSSQPVRRILLDEVDRMPLDVDGEGDPTKLAEKRTSSFGNKKKIFYISTPTTESISVIAREFYKGDQRYYYVPCPHCHHKQKIQWKNIKFQKVDDNTCDPDSVHLLCENEECKAEIKESYKTWMFERGEWIAEAPENAGNKTASFHLSSLYSPLGWESWTNLVNTFLEATHDDLAMKAFINTALGETYKSKVQQPDWVKLFKRKETNFNPFVAHRDIIYVNCAIDTQDNRFAIIVMGYGCDQEAWVLDYHETMLGPAEPESWNEILRYLSTPIRHESGIDLMISEAVMDSGGHYTQQVYDFCSRNSHILKAIKGDNGDNKAMMTRGKALNKDMNGNIYEDSEYLYFVNTIMAKKIIYSALMIEEAGPRYIHFNNMLPESFFEMLTAEAWTMKVENGRYKEVFYKVRQRNEALDVMCYAYALAHQSQLTLEYGSRYEQTWDEVIGTALRAKEQKNQRNNYNNNIHHQRFNNNNLINPNGL